ncbi:hypothetical protein N0V95_007574 [Ascochyta clinopodiicola]|nr:hypothetical protein N0V95_007574 [Ascochyta clinopodiicola]
MIFGGLLDKLQALNISYAYTSNDFATYYDAYRSMVPASETAYFQIGSRVLTADVLSTQSAQLTQTMRDVNQYGTGIGGLSYKIPKHLEDSTLNAVNPRLRSGVVSLTVGTVWNNIDWDLNLANQALLTDVLIPAFDRLLPNSSAAYLNEGDYRESQWQEVFYGSHYARLLDIKNKYDTQNLLWARTAAGSEAWAEQEDGRLCRQE